MKLSCKLDTVYDMSRMKEGLRELSRNGRPGGWGLMMYDYSTEKKMLLGAVLVGWVHVSHAAATPRGREAAMARFPLQGGK